MLIIETTTCDWQTHVGNVQVSLVETETFAWGYTHTATSIAIGPLTSTFNLPIKTVAWRAGGVVLVGVVLITLLILRLINKPTVGARRG